MSGGRIRGQGRPFSRTVRSYPYPVPDTQNPALHERLMGACSDDDYFTFLLRRDVESVLPYGLGGRPGFTATFSGRGAKRAEQQIPPALAPDDSRSTVNDALRDFAHRAAVLLVTCGSLTYEIGFLQYTDVDPPEPFAFELHLVHPGSLDSLRSRPIQYVPDDVPHTHTHKGIGYVELDPARLVTIRLDRTTERAVAEAVAFLQEASNQQTNEYTLAEESMRGKTPFEWRIHNRTTGDLMAAATAAIGWTPRTLYTDRRLDPYMVWRSLQFLAFKIHLRDAIVEGINRALIIAGAVLDFGAQLEVTGVPTLPEVEQARRDLETGQRSLADMMRMSL